MKVISHYKKMILVNDVFEAVLGFLGFILAFIEYEDYFRYFYPPDLIEQAKFEEKCLKYGVYYD